jgi:hypothetical protein
MLTRAQAPRFSRPRSGGRPLTVWVRQLVRKAMHVTWSTRPREWDSSSLTGRCRTEMSDCDRMVGEEER